jgi:hypothetical protein
VPAPERLPVVSGFEDLVYEPRPLLVVPDSRGRVRNWVHALARPWYGAIVVLTSQATPLDYLEYLNRRDKLTMMGPDKRAQARLECWPIGRFEPSTGLLMSSPKLWAPPSRVAGHEQHPERKCQPGKRARQPAHNPCPGVLPLQSRNPDTDREGGDAHRHGPHD